MTPPKTKDVNQGGSKVRVRIQERTAGPRPSQGQSPWGVAAPGPGTAGGAPVHPPRLGIPGGPEAEGVSGYTCPAAANSRPQTSPRLGGRGRQDDRPSIPPHPGIGPSPCHLAFALALLKQRQAIHTPTAIFPLPQKPPLRQTPVSSFSAMPPASARWEMKAGGEPAAPRQPLRSVPRVQKTTTPSMPLSSLPAPLLSGPRIGAEDDPVDGRGGSKKEARAL